MYENKKRVIPYVDPSRLERLQEGKYINSQPWIPTDLNTRFVERISPSKFKIETNGELPKEATSIDFSKGLPVELKELVFNVCFLISIIYKSSFSVSCSPYGFKVRFRDSKEFITFAYEDFIFVDNILDCVVPIEVRFPPVFPLSPPLPPPSRIIKDHHIPPAFFLALVFLILLIVSFILSH